MLEDNHTFDSHKAFAWAMIGSSFIGTVGLMFPFVWMQLKSPLPYMSTPKRKVLLALEAIALHRRKPLNKNCNKPSQILKFYDLGSGDGEAVLAVAKTPGWDATGIELNYTLWSLSNLRRYAMGAKQFFIPTTSGSPYHNQNLFYNCRFWWGDFWTFSIKDADAVMIFGVTPLMSRIAEKIQKECKPGTFVLAYRFRLPIEKCHPRTSHVETDHKISDHDGTKISNINNRAERDQSLTQFGTTYQLLNASLIYDKGEMRIYKVLGDETQESLKMNSN